MRRHCSNPQTHCATSINIIWNDPYLPFVFPDQRIVTKLPSTEQGWQENPEGDKPFPVVSGNVVNQNWVDMKIAFNRQVANSLKRRERHFPRTSPESATGMSAKSTSSRVPSYTYRTESSLASQFKLPEFGDAHNTQEHRIPCYFSCSSGWSRHTHRPQKYVMQTSLNCKGGRQDIGHFTRGDSVLGPAGFLWPQFARTIKLLPKRKKSQGTQTLYSLLQLNPLDQEGNQIQGHWFTLNLPTPPEMLKLFPWRKASCNWVASPLPSNLVHPQGRSWKETKKAGKEERKKVELEGRKWKEKTITKLARCAFLSQQLRLVSRGGSAPHTHPIGDRRQGVRPRWPSPRLQPEPGWPCRPLPLLPLPLGPRQRVVPRDPQALRSTLRAPHCLTSLLGAERKRQGSRPMVWGSRGQGDVPGADYANAHSVRLTAPGGATPAPRPAPQPTPPPARRHLFCAQLTAAGLSFRRPQQFFSPSSRRALHPPAGGRPAPRPRHQEQRPPGLAGPGGAQGPVCSFGGESHHEAWAAAAENSPRSAARVVPRALAGGGCRRASASAAPAVLCTRPEPAPASGAPSWGEVRAGAEGGAGPGVPGKGEKAERRERNRGERN